MRAWFFICILVVGIGFVPITSTHSQKTSSVLLEEKNTFQSGHAYGEDVVIIGSTAFLADGNEGLKIIDLSNAVNPEQIGNIQLENSKIIESYGNYVIVQNTSSNILILDVSDPSVPSIVSDYEASNSIKSLYIDETNSQMYVLMGTVGIDVLSLSDPSNPLFMEHLDIYGASYMKSVNSNAYLVVNGTHIVKYDLSNLLNPLFSYAIGINTPFAFDIQNDSILFVASQAYGLYIINDTSSSFDLLSNLDTQNALDIKTEGNYSYVADTIRGLKIIDHSNLSLPIIADEESVAFTVYAKSIAKSGDMALLAAGNLDMPVLDVSNPKLIVATSIFNPLSTNYNSIVVKDQYLYTTSEYDGLLIYYSTDTVNYQLIGQYRSYWAIEVEISEDGKYAYLSDGRSGFIILDITDKTNPTYVGGYDPLQSVMRARINDNIAFVVENLNGLRIFNISDPSSPQLLSTYTATYMQDVLFDQNLIYLAKGTDGIDIINVTDTAAPVLISNIDYSNDPYFMDAYRIDLVDNLLYVADWQRGFKIINVTDPYNPNLVSRLQLNYGKGIKIHDGIAYMIEGDVEQLTAFDVPDPLAIRQLVSTPIPGIDWEGEIEIKYNQIYVAHGLGGISIYQPKTIITTTTTETSTSFLTDTSTITQTQTLTDTVISTNTETSTETITESNTLNNTVTTTETQTQTLPVSTVTSTETNTVISTQTETLTETETTVSTETTTNTTTEISTFISSAPSPAPIDFSAIIFGIIITSVMIRKRSMPK